MSFLTAPTADQVRAKHCSQEALRAYLARQVEMKESVKTQRRMQAEAFAEEQQHQYVSWKQAQADAVAEKIAQRERYRHDLDAQLTADRERKQHARDLQRRGTEDAGATISTGRHGQPVNTIRSATGQLVPYVLEEHPVLSTLGTTIRFAVVSAEDGKSIKMARKRAEKFIE